MKMRRKVLASMLFAFLPWLAMAQSTDDLYFVPKKEKKTEVSQKVGVVPKEVSNKTVNELPSNTAIVVKDVKGNVRDVDEYNRRYTSRENTFSYENDTLYIEEKPYGERGEWVNGFQGSDMDYEYAMRLVMMMACMLIFSLHTPTVCGGTGDGHMASMVQDGGSDGDGILLGTRHGILRGIMADGILLGLQVIGEAIGEVTGVATGDLDGITTILIMDGTADGIVLVIPITERVDTNHIIEETLFPVRVLRIPDVLSHHQL